LICLKLNGQSFEKLQAEIYILNSCSKQAHIAIEFKNIFTGFENIKDSLVVKWALNGNEIQRSGKKYLYATQSGNYTCEVWNSNTKITSNTLEINEFKNSSFKMWLLLSPYPYVDPFNNICTQNEYNKQSSTNISNYYFGPPTTTFPAKYLDETNSDSHFNWYVNDKIQNHPITGPLLNDDIYLQNIRLQVTDGQCDFNSNTTPVYNYSLPKKGLKNFEFCSGDTTDILLEKNWNNFARKFIWYKDGQLFSEKIDESNSSYETYSKQKLKTTLPGNYILKTIYAKYSDGKYFFNENSCSYWSDSISVSQVPLPTASISGNNAIEFGQPTDLKFELTSAPPWQIKLNTGEEFSIKESPYTLKVRPLSDMKYSINSVENICGMGTTSGEAVIKVTILADEKSAEENANLRVFPIPVTDAFELEILETNEKNAQIILLNNLGVEMQNHLTKAINNRINKTLNINHLPAGMYILKVNIGEKIIEKRILKN
jgi:hypothetical protein